MIYRILGCQISSCPVVWLNHFSKPDEAPLLLPEYDDAAVIVTTTLAAAKTPKMRTKRLKIGIRGNSKHNRCDHQQSEKTKTIDHGLLLVTLWFQLKSLHRKFFSFAHLLVDRCRRHCRNESIVSANLRGALFGNALPAASLSTTRSVRMIFQTKTNSMPPDNLSFSLDGEASQVDNVARLQTSHYNQWHKWVWANLEVTVVFENRDQYPVEAWWKDSGGATHLFTFARDPSLPIVGTCFERTS